MTIVEGAQRVVALFAGGWFSVFLVRCFRSGQFPYARGEDGYPKFWERRENPVKFWYAVLMSAIVTCGCFWYVLGFRL